MKPTIPDTGTVIRLEGGSAVVRMKHEGSCRKCGAAAVGLCKGGLMQELTVRNSRQARVGDTVKIGLAQGVQFTGYFLAYVVPAAALVLGAAGGHVLGAAAGLQWLDALAGFFCLFVASFFSLRRLRRIDASHAIEVEQVLSDPLTPWYRTPDDGAISEYSVSGYSVPH